ncbi:cupin domain-containing protein [Streptomyces triculaminicus]|uniref:cupin domain-containing protein n=1 Tax=Streptomyces triculaminicus TaxID=2816232 RepID=UPI0033C99F48
MSQHAIAPVHLPYTQGAPFDFGSHTNDFLVHREGSLATEVFTVRVPGGGAVPEHVHPDMEQTFVFLSGVGEAVLRRDGEVHRYRCRGGDTLFVPTGWHHSVSAPGPDGCVYVTVNAFLPDADRIGDSAVAHAEIVAHAFRAAGPPVAAAPDAVALSRCAEAAFRTDEAGRVWPQDFAAFDATLTGDPGTYRVARVGPFEYVTAVTPVARVLDEDLADLLHHAVDGTLPVYVEGSQSPLSVKTPCASSDLDVLLAVETAADLTTARKAVDALLAVQPEVPVPLSPGVVHVGWLGLPNFYSALALDPASPDRTWWTAATRDRHREAARRQHEGLQLLRDDQRMRRLLQSSLAVLDQNTAAVSEWRTTPRWRGYL